MPDNLEIHCLLCDEIYKECEPIVKICPNCGNTDMKKTVYLVEEEE